MSLIEACNKAETLASTTGLQHAVVFTGALDYSYRIARIAAGALDYSYRVTRITADNWATDGAHVIYATKAGR
jgi:hypothetical protein